MSDPVRIKAASVVRAWEAIGRCEDEFGSPSEYCGELYDALDTRISELRMVLRDFPSAPPAAL